MFLEESRELTSAAKKLLVSTGFPLQRSNVLTFALGVSTNIEEALPAGLWTRAVASPFADRPAKFPDRLDECRRLRDPAVLDNPALAIRPVDVHRRRNIAGESVRRSSPSRRRHRASRLRQFCRPGRVLPQCRIGRSCHIPDADRCRHTSACLRYSQKAAGSSPVRKSAPSRRTGGGSCAATRPPRARRSDTAALRS